jgi:hypothetical protein
MSNYTNHFKNGKFVGEYTIDEALEDYKGRMEWDKTMNNNDVKFAINPIFYDGIRAYMAQTTSPYYLSVYIDFCKENNYPYTLDLVEGIKKVKSLNNHPIQKEYKKDISSNTPIDEDIDEAEQFLNISNSFDFLDEDNENREESIKYIKKRLKFGKFLGKQDEYKLIDQLWCYGASLEEIQAKVHWVTKKAYEVAKYGKFQSLSSIAKLNNEDLINFCIENNVKIGYIYDKIQYWNNYRLQCLAKMINNHFYYSIKRLPFKYHNYNPICWLNHKLDDIVFKNSNYMYSFKIKWDKSLGVTPFDKIENKIYDIF